MAIKLGDGYVNITGDATPLQNSLTKSFRAVGAAATAAGAVIVGVLTKSVQLFGEQERVEKQLETVIRSTGQAAGLTAEDIKNLASSLQSQTKYGDEAVISATNLLLTFKEIKGEILPDTVEMVLDVSTAMGQDLKQSAIQLGKALNDPIKGLGGLSRVGIQFTDQQKEMITAMVEAGNVAGAQRLILDELASQFGGSAAAAAETFTGRLQQLKNSFGDLLETIGAVIAEGEGSVLGKLIGWLKQGVDAIQKWADANPKLFETIVLITGGLGALGIILGPLLIALPFLATGIGVVGSAFAALLSPIGAVIIAIGGIIFLLVQEMKPELERAKSWIKDNWDQISRIFSFAADFIVSVLRAFMSFLRIALTTISAIFGGIAGGISDAWGNMTGAVDDGTESTLDSLEMFAKEMSLGMEYAADLMAEAAVWFEDHWEDIYGVFEFFSTQIVEPLIALGIAVETAWYGIVGVFQWATNALYNIYQNIVEIVNAIAQGIGDAFRYAARLLGLAGGGVIPFAMGGITNFAMGGITQGLARAAQGGLFGHQLIRVGERGEEIIASPGRGSRVMPNHEMREMVKKGAEGEGASTVNFNAPLIGRAELSSNMDVEKTAVKLADKVNDELVARGIVKSIKRVAGGV